MAVKYRLSQLDALEAEAVHIIREAGAAAERVGLLFSGGKDSAVLAHLAAKAHWPAAPPLTALHVDTGHNFPEVLEFRDRAAAELGLTLRVARVQDDIDAGRAADVPRGASRNRLQSATLLRAIAEHRLGAVLGGARRDEDKARAKERVFSFRDEFGQWDPRAQRPELWSLYNARHARGEHVRVFPLSNWTELDVWRYIERERIALPSLYYAHRRTVYHRDGMLLADTEHGPPAAGEQPFTALVRFRTVGDATCTGCVESAAATPAEVIAETAASDVSERGATRADDRISSSGMEDRKRDGYF